MNECLGDLNFLNSFAVLTLAGIPETDESFPAEELNLSILLSFLLFVRYWLKQKLLKAKNKYLYKEDE